MREGKGCRIAGMKKPVCCPPKAGFGAGHSKRASVSIQQWRRIANWQMRELCYIDPPNGPVSALSLIHI